MGKRGVAADKCHKEAAANGPSKVTQWRPKKQGSEADQANDSTAQSGTAHARNSAIPVSPTLNAAMTGSFVPPGCDAGVEEDDEQVRHYEDGLVKGFWCPARLRGRNESLIEAVNDWHFAMLNDSHRNQFYWKSMEGVVKDKKVIDIGAGSCLLSLMAGKLGATKVVAIEASRDMVQLANLNIERNEQKDKIRVVHNLSSNVVLPEKEKADVIVSETLGALLLGEGTLDYMADARRRLAKPGAAVIPALGNQYAVLVSSPTLAMISSVQSDCNHGFDLSAIGSLQDTGNLFFSKQWGFRLNSLSDLQLMSERFKILSVEFGTTVRKDIPLVKTFRLEALHSGVVHAVVASWEVFGDMEKTHRMSTHPEETKDEPWGFARDMQWGQGLQLIEDFGVAENSSRNSPPQPFEVKKGEALLLTARFSNPCRQTFQFTLQRDRSAVGSDP